MEQAKEKKINIICTERLKHYFSITEKALAIAKKSINPEKKAEAREILDMAEAYLSDAHHFQKIGNWVNSFAAINYAHGWLDSGARLKIFLVTDNKLFTI
jgi:hypothetical protein